MHAVIAMKSADAGKCGCAVSTLKDCTKYTLDGTFSRAKGTRTSSFMPQGCCRDAHGHSKILPSNPIIRLTNFAKLYVRYISHHELLKK